MKEINYKNLIDKKLSKKTKEEDGTAYVAIDGQYEEQSGYGYTQSEWITLYNGIMPLIADEDGRNILWSDTTIILPENVSPNSVNKIRLIISGENNHDVTSEIVYKDPIDNIINFGNPWFSDDSAENNGLEYGVAINGNNIYMGAYDTFISNGDHVTIMGCILSVKTIDPSLIPVNEVFVKGEGEYSIRAKNNTTYASGDYAVAEGRNTQASGVSSHAEGYVTKANGHYSHAEGFGTYALGQQSHAEGYQTNASNTSAHAEGSQTKAWSNASHAEGFQTAARSNYSHAEGNNTISLGIASHAEGATTTTYDDYSHAEGGSSSYQLQLTGSGKTYTMPIAGNNYLIGQVVKCNDTITYITAYSAIDTSSCQITVKTSLGTLNSATCTIYPGPTAIGKYSHAEGSKTTALSDYSHAEGLVTRASGSNSHAEGSNSIAAGVSSHAEGSSIANGRCSHTEGNSTLASSDYAHAEGVCTTASGNSSHAEGAATTASGVASHAEGYYANAIGAGSHAEGGASNSITILLTGSGTSYTSTTNIEDYYYGKTIKYENVTTYISSVSPKDNSIEVKQSLGELNSASCIVYLYASSAYGNCSHAEGNCTVAFGVNSHASGTNTVSYGTSSHAEGLKTISLSGASYSHAEGNLSICAGNDSHAEGYATVAYGLDSHAEGGSSAYTGITLTGSGTSYTSTSQIPDYYLGKQIQHNGVRTCIKSIDSANNKITVYSSLGTLNSESCSLYYKSPSAYGEYSHAEGCGTLTKGKYSHAEGENVISKGLASHAEGCKTLANGSYSHAEGTCTIASGANQHAAGKYNVEDLNNTYAEIIGIGTKDNSRKNGRTLDWSGNEQLAGSLTLGLGTTDQITVTAAQLKQLIALLGG